MRCMTHKTDPTRESNIWGMEEHTKNTATTHKADLEKMSESGDNNRIPKSLAKSDGVVPKSDGEICYWINFRRVNEAVKFDETQWLGLINAWEEWPGLLNHTMIWSKATGKSLLSKKHNRKQCFLPNGASLNLRGCHLVYIWLQPHNILST